MRNINDVGRVFVQNDLVKRKAKSSWKSSKKIFRIQKGLGLDPDVVTCDEQDIISALQVAFEEEIIFTQHSIKNRRTDAQTVMFVDLINQGF